MGLNDGVLDDLEDHDLLEEGIAIPPGANSSEYVQVVASNKRGDLMTDEEILDIPLPNEKVDFIVAKNGLAKVIDLKEVEKTLLAQEAISKSDIVRINNDCDNVLSSLSLETFTQLRTKVNYATTLKLIKNRIAQEEGNYVSDFNEFINSFLPSTNNYLSSLKDIGLSKLQERVITLIADIKNVENDIFENKDLVFKDGENFINIVKTPIKDINFLTLECPSPLKDDFIKLDKAVGNIKALVANNNLSYYITTCLSQQEVQEINFSKISLTNVLETLTLEDLFKVFSSDIHTQFVNALVDKINNIVSVTFEKFSKFTSQRPEKDYFEEIKDLLIEHDKEFTEVFDSVIFIGDIIDKSNRLIYNFSYVIEIVKKL